MSEPHLPRPIRIVAVGTSSITARTVRAAVGAPDLRFTGIVSRDRTRAEALSAELADAAPGLSGVDWPTALASAAVDAVYVASPNAVHAGQVREALEAGKHVLCEKPATTSAAEFADLCALAASRGLVLVENMRSAHDPLMQRLADLLPSIGVVRHVSFSFCQRSGRYAELLAGRDVRIFDPALGGGALNDLGVYVTHPLVRLFGLPDAVSAHIVAVRTGADASGAALARYDGFVAQLAWSKSTQGVGGSEIQGEDGTLWVDHIADLGRLTRTGRDGDVLEVAGSAEPDNITHALRHFAALVGGAGSPAEDQRWTHDSLVLLERIRAAARRG